MEISGNPDPLLAAAIVAAIVQMDEELAAAAAVAPTRPGQGRWAAGGIPTPLQAPFVARPGPDRDGWGLTDGDRESPGPG